MLKKRKLKNALKYYMARQKTLNSIISLLDESHLDYAIVGGFVKCVLYIDTEPRDFDIIVNCDSIILKGLIDSIGISYRTNDFGGIKIIKPLDDSSTDKDIDLWTLKSHVPFKSLSHNSKRHYDFKDIPNSAWLSIDGATWVVPKNKLYIKNLKNTIKSNEVFITDYSLFKEYKQENTFILAAKLINYYYLGYTLSSDCWEIIKSEMTNNPTSVEHFLESHYKYDISWLNFIDEKIISKIS